jgi:sRNA-binding protein
MRFHARNEDGSIVEVVVDKALGEARQQASTLKALVAELRASRAGKKEEPKPEATRRDELAKRREERRRAAGL